MPSSPKKTQKTGSVLLGQELRRLRGGRTLREIAQLTKSPPLVNHVATVSEAGLCEIESGKTMPTLQTMHALSVIYKTSMSQLMAYVTEEKVAAASNVGDRSPEGLAAEFATLLAAHEWPRALAVAIAAEQIVKDEARQVAWRANRASCLSRMGQHDEALALLTRCSESNALSDRQRLELLHNLAGSHHNAGHLRTAASVAKEALELSARCEAPASLQASLELSRATMLIEAEMARHPQADERRVREAQRLLESAAASWSVSDVAGLNWLAIAKARAHFCLGNLLMAERDLARVIDTATALRDNSVAAFAMLSLATVRERQARGDEAASLLERALMAAQAAAEPDLMFEASFRLFLHHRTGRPGLATTHLRRCGEIFPLISACTYWPRQYENFQRSAP
jgi:tetratricopeptide (TPR) repeat protein